MRRLPLLPDAVPGDRHSRVYWPPPRRTTTRRAQSILRRHDDRRRRDRPDTHLDVLDAGIGPAAAGHLCPIGSRYSFCGKCHQCSGMFSRKLDEFGFGTENSGSDEFNGNSEFRPIFMTGRNLSGTRPTECPAVRAQANTSPSDSSA
jgi:hypothetical protein